MKRFTVTWPLLVALLSLGLTACDDSSEPEGGGNGYDREALLANYANNIIVPGYTALDKDATALKTSLDNLTQNPTAEALDTAQARLKRTWLSWQAVNMFEFGPAMENFLKTNVDTWPADVQQIESNLSAGAWNLGTASNYPAKGFPGLDYLLNDSTDAHILSRLGEATYQQYIQELGADLQSLCAATLSGWTDGYTQQYIENTGTDAGSSISLTVNEYIREYEALRRHRIADCSGFRTGGEVRPDLVEAYYGGYSAELAKANLDAYIRQFRGIGADGTNGEGWADYLDHLNATSGSDPLSQVINEQLARAEAKLNVVPDPLSETCQTQTQAVLDINTELQKAIPLLKNEMTSALGVSVTFSSGDGD